MKVTYGDQLAAVVSAELLKRTVHKQLYSQHSLRFRTDANADFRRYLTNIAKHASSRTSDRGGKSDTHATRQCH